MNTHNRPKVLKTKSISYTFDQQFDGRFETLSEYSYNLYNQVIKQRTKTSLANEWRTRDITYHGINHTLPVSVTEYYDVGSVKRYISGVERTFTNTIKPDQVKLRETAVQTVTSLSQVPLTTRLDYGSYNEFDKPLSYRKSDDIVVSLIWGHQGNFVTAQATNADPMDIAYCSFEESEISGNWTKSAGTANLNIEGDAVSGKKVLSAVGGVILTKNSLNPAKTYIVSFWAKGSNSLIVNGSTKSGSSGGLEVLRMGNQWTIQCERSTQFT